MQGFLFSGGVSGWQVSFCHSFHRNTSTILLFLDSNVNRTIRFMLQTKVRLKIGGDGSNGILMLFYAAGSNVNVLACNANNFYKSVLPTPALRVNPCDDFALPQCLNVPKETAPAPRLSIQDPLCTPNLPFSPRHSARRHPHRTRQCLECTLCLVMVVVPSDHINV